jgi:benzoyl-CoA reductase/2-hydroxyglutaryl-CoA dehydratase subunit BcrC/BadD/HgdB
MMHDDKETLVEQLRDYRRRIVNGGEVTDEELRDSIAKLRQLRDSTSSVAKTAATRKAVKKVTTADAEDLLKDLLS